MAKFIIGDTVSVNGLGPAEITGWDEEGDRYSIVRQVGNGIDNLSGHISNTQIEFYPGYERGEDDTVTQAQREADADAEIAAARAAEAAAKDEKAGSVPGSDED